MLHTLKIANSEGKGRYQGQIPSCHACIFGKATKIPWRLKGKNISRIKPVTAAGECISINQHESPTPGLVAQMKGIPTIRRNKYVTVIVDHYSRFTFFYPSETMTSDEALKTKLDFEQLTKEMGVSIKQTIM